MFETNNTSRMHNPLSLLGDANHLWAHVSLRIHVPWFYVVFSMSYEDGSRKSDILFVSNIDDVIGMNHEPLIQLEEVYLVSPGHLNKSSKWLMEPLGKLLVGLEPEHDQYAHIYVVENGNRYLDSALGSKEEELRGINTLFSNKN